MTASASSPVTRRSSATLHRWIRRLHLWIGAWGALAAVLYGSTGLIMNHRYDATPWPQGDSKDISKKTLAVPTQARTSAEALSLWLRDSQGLDAQIIRKPKPAERSERASKPAREGVSTRTSVRSGERKAPQRWSLSGGTASDSWSLEYAPGEATADLKRSEHSTLAALNRLHKAVAGGIGWRLLGDSFAIAMILLGLSGLWMWARGRSAKQMAMSVFAASLAAWALVVIPNLF
jgi:uncharacterized protein